MDKFLGKFGLVAIAVFVLLGLVHMSLSVYEKILDVQVKQVEDK